MPDAYEDQPEIHDVYAAIADNEERNAMITKDVLAVLEEGRTPLILTQRTQQVKLLTETLQIYCKNVILLTGGRSASEKRASNQKLAAVQDDESLVLVATGKFVGEGFDFPRLDSLFIAAPISWQGLLQQYIGRLNRNYKDKQLLQIYDYIDIGIKQAESMYFKRLKHYRAQNYQVVEAGQGDSGGRCVFDGKEFWEPLFAEIFQARKEVVITCSHLYPSSVARTIKLLEEQHLRSGVHLTIITDPVAAYPAEKQKNIRVLQQQLAALSNITLVANQVLRSSFLVIDRATIWFGNASPLGYTSVQQSVMRFVSREVVERLLASE